MSNSKINNSMDDVQMTDGDTNDVKTTATVTSPIATGQQNATMSTTNMVGGGGLPLPRKKRRQTSEAWKHFTRLPLSETKGKHRARCNYCGTDYASHPTNCGTKQLLRHYEKCPKNPNKASKQQSIFSVNSSKSLTHQVYDEEECRKAIARFVIKDEMPFRTVEGEGFKDMIHRFEPRFKIPSRWTVARDCYQVYLEEARKLKKYFKRSKVRVSLTTDCWTSIQNTNYMCLTAHWIDDDWNLQKRILNFCVIENHKGDTIGAKLETCLLNWGIDKVLTVTVDNASSNDTALAYLRKRLRGWNGLILDGEFMHMRCAAHILNLIVSEGLKDVNKSIELIRHAIKFVRSSPSRLNKFKELIVKERIDSKSLLCLDCPTRWNSTYLMLESAIKFVKVFDRMEEEDADYKEYFKKKVRLDSSRDDTIYDGEATTHPPSAYDWGVAKEFLVFLKLFYSMTLKFSGSNYVTTNTCLLHIVAIQSSLHKSATSEYSLLTDMAIRMQLKYNKYWGDIEKMNPLLIIGVILDPRYKLTYVNVVFDRAFSNDPMKREVTLKHVMSVLHRLYDEYAVNVKPSDDDASTSQQSLQQADSVASGDVVSELVPNVEEAIEDDPTYQEFLVSASTACKKPEQISEIDEYLQAGLCGLADPKFDLLAWWRVNASKYKVLHLIARDLLAVPVSTVSSESAFSTGGRVLDTFRSSLSSKMAESLVCAQNWLCTNQPKANDLDVDNFDESTSIVIEQESAATHSTISSDSEADHDDDTQDLDG